MRMCARVCVRACTDCFCWDFCVRVGISVRTRAFVHTPIYWITFYFGDYALHIWHHSFNYRLHVQCDFERATSACVSIWAMIAQSDTRFSILRKLCVCWQYSLNKKDSKIPTLDASKRSIRLMCGQLDSGIVYEFKIYSLDYIVYN